MTEVQIVHLCRQWGLGYVWAIGRLSIGRREWDVAQQKVLRIVTTIVSISLLEEVSRVLLLVLHRGRKSMARYN